MKWRMNMGKVRWGVINNSTGEVLVEICGPDIFEEDMVQEMGVFANKTRNSDGISCDVTELPIQK